MALFVRLTSYKKRGFWSTCDWTILVSNPLYLIPADQIESNLWARRAAAPVAGVLDEPYSQLTPFSGVAVQARQST
jgi:hypothetical protein